MGTLTVTPNAQPIYPDGLQDSFIIKNNGPQTVYVDSDSSISVNSLAIPPTGVLAWDANRPLWMVCSPSVSGATNAALTVGISSQVTIVRNSAVPVYTGRLDGTIYQQQIVTAPATSQANFTNAIDTSAYESIQIVLKASDYSYARGDAILDRKKYAIAIKWFDRSGNVLWVDEYASLCQSEQDLIAPDLIATYADGISPLTIAQAASVRLTTKVKGTSCVINITNSDNVNPLHYALTVIGTTRALPNRLCFTAYDTMPHTLQAGFPMVITALDSNGFGMDMGSGAMNYSSLVLPCISPTLRIHWLGGIGINGGGAIMYVRDPWQDRVRPGAIIPLNNAQEGDAAWTQLPMTRPTMFSFAGHPQNGGIDLASFQMRFSWDDV